MIASENKFQKIIRTILDILNVLLGVGVVVLAVMAFINTDNNKWLFPIIFMMGGVMNLFTGIKAMMTDRKVTGIVSVVAAAVLAVISIMSYIAIGGR